MKFNEEVSKEEKRHAGHTDVENTPLEVHSKMKLEREFREHVREQIEHALRHNATRVERVEVWFDDVNGPKGGIDTVCRVTLVMGGQPNLFVEEQADSPAAALDQLAPRLAHVLDRAADRKGHGAPKAGDKHAHRGSKTESVAVADAAARSEAAASEPDATSSDNGTRRSRRHP